MCLSAKNVRKNFRIKQADRDLQTIISVADLVVGQCVVKDVSDSSGRLLMPAGTILDQKRILLLECWGVEEVLIKVETAVKQEPPQAEEEELDDDAKAAIVKRLNKRFALHDREHPISKALYDCSLNYNRKQMRGVQ